MDNQSRNAKITRTSIIGIVVNLVIATMKIVLGLLTSSIAISSEGINNASDSASSFLTLIGAKLSTKHPDEKHPFGYGRIEYLTGMVVGILILYAGFSLFRESIEGIIHPVKMEVTILAIVLIAVSAVFKLVLGLYTIKVGKSVDSDVLIAVGEDGRNDSFISIVTIISSVIFLVFGISLDAYAGLLFAFIVAKTGYEALKNTVSDILGRPGDAELAKTIYKEVLATDGILSAADMMLHNYGPESYSGSVNIEIDHNRSVGEIYEQIHALQLRIMHEHNVTMVFGIYAVDRDTEQSKEMRKYIVSFVKAEEYVKSFHALYISEETQSIYVDFIVDYKLQDWDALKAKFTEYMKQKYPQYALQLTIETEFV